MSAKDSSGDKLIDSIRKAKAQAAAGPGKPAKPGSRSALKKGAGNKAAAKKAKTKKGAVKKIATKRAAAGNSRAKGQTKRSFAPSRSQPRDPFQHGRRVWPD